MSTAASREAELVELAREFIARADDLERDLAEAVDWALGDDFRGKLRRIVAEHDYQEAAPEREARDFTAYAEGLRNGKADRLLGQRSRYADLPEHGPYADGYRRGVLGLDEPAGSRS